ncbi:MAG: Gfo/Idh/MocA family protein [Salinibacter sp.]|uniref:Gfo/Idh/MocA family protein n=1 Tax=Salinibacter sp. TaxID=2065818 RepID=UPI0035D4AB77
MHDYTRREFLETGSTVLAGAGLSTTAPHTASADDSVPPSDRLRFGAIGINGMGWNDVAAHQKIEGVECVALCDVDRNVLEKRASELEDRTGKTPDLYDDYRQLLEDDALDFVVIGTPDHWHCLQMVHACQAGKDVYVEKPLGNTIAECDVMRRAAEKTGRVVQVGQWQRSSDHWQNAVDYLQSGELGRIRHTKAWAYMGWKRRLPEKPHTEVPEGVNYDMWLGPAPERPFNPNRFHYTFRWFWDYAGGLMTDWGVHLLDYLLIGKELSAPRSVASTGGKFGFPGDARETPDTQQALYQFDDVTMEWKHAAGVGNGPYDRGHGVAFVGNNGTLVIDRNGWEVLPEIEDEQYRLDPIPPREGEGGLDVHAQNFVDSIREEATLNAPVEAAADTAVSCHIGNVAFRVGHDVEWDGEARQFVDDPEANAFIEPTYRDPWTLPSV